jgi:predicted Zn-ribbon and HTH transcriptional regulator
MADSNLQFIHDVLDIFVVKTNVSISHGLQCPDYTILKADKTENYFINTKEQIVMDDNKKRVSYLVADRSGRAGLSVGLGPLACWDCGFEFRLGHGFLSYEYCVLSGRSVCDEAITGPEESYRMWNVRV